MMTSQLRWAQCVAIIYVTLVCERTIFLKVLPFTLLLISIWMISFFCSVCGTEDCTFNCVLIVIVNVCILFNHCVNNVYIVFAQ